ncbi:MAG TPA: cupin domain-containing protein [bacterium]|nr:cupin domain-containing protein [bacterium]
MSTDQGNDFRPSDFLESDVFADVNSCGEKRCMDAKRLIELLGLTPHLAEGGYFKETYRSIERIPEDGLPARFRSARNLATAIFYLLTPDTCSAFHRLQSDEVFHFYLGDPVTLVMLYPNLLSERIVLGSDLESGQSVQCLVPRGTWQGMFLNDGGKFALMGTTVAPGFEFDDFECGDRDILLSEYPQEASAIVRLTRSSR